MQWQLRHVNPSWPTDDTPSGPRSHLLEKLGEFNKPTM
jgi:hypothetical protein